MNTAIEITKAVHPNYPEGETMLYMACPPMADPSGIEHEYILVCLIRHNDGLNTGYILPASSEGQLLTNAVMNGSVYRSKGFDDHSSVLANAGYEIEIII